MDIFFRWLKENFGVKEVFFKLIDKNKENKLRELESKVKICRKCRLFKFRRNIVFGSGNFYASLMFVGEAPGGEEDKVGLPFVGRAGLLLTKILNEFGIDRDKDCYITNVLKCRPPKNRDPQKDEIEACKGYLFEQIEIIKPKVIVCLGRYSTALLVGGVPTLSLYRGKVFEFMGAKVIPTYHPSALLRRPILENDFKNDLKKALDLLENG